MTIFWTKTAALGIEERLATLESDFRSLKSANKHLELEWEELYDKVRRQMSRMSKRSAVDAPPLSNGEDAEVVDDGLDPISRSILRRRGMPRIQT